MEECGKRSNRATNGEERTSDTVIMGIIVIGIFAFAFDLLIRYLERLLIPWKGRI